MNENVSGYMYIEIDGVNYTASVTDGFATYTTATPLSAGTHTLNVYYLGNTNYNASSYLGYTVIVKDKQTVNVDVIANTTLVVGGNVTFIPTINGQNTTVSENITITIAGVEKNNLTNLVAGTVSVTVTFAGNETHKQASKTKTFTVNKLPASIIGIGADSVYVGKLSNITVLMSNNINATIMVEINGQNRSVNVVNGTGVLSIAFSAGNHTVWAHFAGDETYNPATSINGTVEVKDKLAANIEIVEPVWNITGNNTIVVKVNGVATVANVTVTVNGVNGTLINPVIPDTYRVVATFAGNDTHKAGRAEEVFTVDKLDATITSIEAAEVIVGKQTLINVTMGNIESGYVTINVAGQNRTVVVNNYTALLNVTLEAGNHEVTVYYLGNEIYNPVNATGVAKVKDKENVTIDIVEPVWNITGNNTIVVYINGKVANNNLTVTVNTVNNAIINPVIPGTYRVVATFAGNDTHKAGRAEAVFTVNKLNATIDTITAPDVIVGQTTVINVTMKNIESGYLIINIDGENHTAEIINYNGTLSVVLGVGDYDITVYYKGSEIYNPTNITRSTKVKDKEDVTIEIIKPDLVIGQSARFTVKINGKVTNNNVTYTINNAKTDTITSVSPITYRVVATFAGNSTHKAGSVEKTYTVNKTQAVIDNVYIAPVTDGQKSLINVTKQVMY